MRPSQQIRGAPGSGIYFDDQPARLLQQLSTFQVPDMHKWIDRDLAQ